MFDALINGFRSRPATIEGHEKRLVELSAQIDDATRDLKDSEARAVDAAINADALHAIAEEVSKITAELAALRAGKGKLESELQALREQAAEAALTAKLDAAKERVAAWRQRAVDLSEKLQPLLVETGTLINEVNQNYGFLIGPVSGEALHAALGALAHTKDNADAISLFLAQRNADCADRVLAIK